MKRERNFDIWLEDQRLRHGVQQKYRFVVERISNFSDRVLLALLADAPLPDFWMKVPGTWRVSLQ